MDPPFEVGGGFMSVSDRPGLGHELRDDYLAQPLPF
jgi:L-alanine-DL-glutamate epimerase-like enolase superfamily enzyme